MTRHRYNFKRLSKQSMGVIRQANVILEEYASQGFTLTLRQLYYQFVARGLVENTQRSYNRLGGIIGEGRLCGHIDWEHIEDRTRNLSLLEHFESADDALKRLADWYHVDMWRHQRYRPEVWIEKDALLGVVQGVCNENDVPFFSCRGYTSLSEMWRTSMRMQYWLENGQTPIVLHFGDHDPSGIDMSRDIYDRIGDTFLTECEFVREALTMEQINEIKPPPNPAKVTDSRYKTYVEKYGTESWELDALEPSMFREIIESRLITLRDDKQWKRDLAAKKRVKSRLIEVANEFDSLPELKVKITDLEKENVSLAAKVKRLGSQNKKSSKRKHK